MRCREFRNKVTDWVRTGGSEHSEELSRHAATCRECSKRLREERALGLAFDRLRKLHAAEETSPLVEQSLLADFRSVRGQNWFCEPDAAQVPKAGAGRHPALALAAVLLLGCGLVVWFVLLAWSRSTTGPQAPGHSEQPVARMPHLTGQAGDSPALPRKEDLARTEPAPMQVRPSQTVRRPERVASQVRRGTRAARPDRASAPAESRESTGFIPTMIPLETESDYGLQLVRVELPRSTMASFGLRVDRRQLNRPVKADLLIGPDGLTRAIRFLQ